LWAHALGKVLRERGTAAVREVADCPWAGVPRAPGAWLRQSAAKTRPLAAPPPLVDREQAVARRRPAEEQQEVGARPSEERLAAARPPGGQQAGPRPVP